MPPAVAAAGILGAGAIGGALIGSSSAKSAANAQATADQAGIAEQQREYNQTRSDFMPYLNAGTSALGNMSDLLGLNGNDKAQSAISSLQQSPLYTSLYNNGREAVLQNASATGGLRGGNTENALAQFGSDTLSSVIQNQLSNLGGIAGMGQGAAGSVSAFGANAANQISGLDQAQGNAAASADLTSGALWAKALSNIAGQASSTNFLSALPKVF